MRKLNNETIWIFKNQTVKTIMRGSNKNQSYQIYLHVLYKLNKKGFGLPLFELSPHPPPSSPFFGNKNLDPRMQSIIPGLRY